MRKLKKLQWFVMGVLAVVLLQVGVVLLVGRSSRPGPAPPKGTAVSTPWGAIDIDEVSTAPNSPLQRSIADSIRAERPEQFDPDGDGIRNYDMLALSGGGANGAFGAGFLCGWTAAGTRPDFKIVTGISTGSLQAVCAFLGPEFDETLKEVFTKYRTRDIYRRRFVLAPLFRDAVNDTTPLKKLIAHHIDKDVLAAVAKRHAEGRRLFIGTVNIDNWEFVIWDMGRIASSERPDAVQHFRRVLLASCSVPVFFPPVYFRVRDNGRDFYEMHTDGGAYAQVFFRGFLLDFDDALADAGVPDRAVKAKLYVITNSKIQNRHPRRTTRPRAVSIAAATIGGLFQVTGSTSLYRMYVLSARYKIDFHLASISAGLGPGLRPDRLQ